MGEVPLKLFTPASERQGVDGAASRGGSGGGYIFIWENGARELEVGTCTGVSRS